MLFCMHTMNLDLQIPVLLVRINNFHQDGLYFSIGELHLTTGLRMIRGSYLVLNTIFG